jgi:hypothetical protein
VSYKKQELLSVHDHLGFHLWFLMGVCVAHLFSFLCCVLCFVCLCPVSCMSNVASVSGLSILDFPLVFSKTRIDWILAVHRNIQTQVSLPLIFNYASNFSRNLLRILFFIFLSIMFQQYSFEAWKWELGTIFTIIQQALH